MAHPTTPKWIDFLLDRRQKEGTWAKAAHEQPLDAMNSLNSAAETMQLEVAATGGDAAMMVAMNNGDIRFVHNIALAKTEGEFTLVGAMGIGHVSTFAMLVLEEEKEIVGKAFFEIVRNGKFDARGRLVGDRPKPVAGATVSSAAGSVATTLRSDFRQSPFHEEGGSLTVGLDRLIRAYKSIDPPTKVQKAVTPKFLKALYNHFVDDNGRNEGNTLNAHLVDIYLGMFFFAGRCCEYAETPEGGRTKRIAMGDITFRDVNMNIMEVNCEEDLNRARYVTLRFRDQKNGDKFDMRTQGRTKRADLDPVLRLGWAVLRIRRRVIGWDDDTDLCTIGTTPNRLRITDKLVLETIREVCRIYGGKKTFGFDPKEIGNKSLRSGAAMALALSRKNHSDMRIMILGRWRSYAFMAYIRPQIIELTSNLAEDMVDLSVTDATNQGEEMRLDF